MREKNLSPENSPTALKDRSPVLKQKTMDVTHKGRNSPTKRNEGEDAGSDTEKHQEKAKYNSLLSLRSTVLHYLHVIVF